MCALFLLWLHHNLGPLHQMDVKNTFLYSDLKEEVYIKLPYGMHTPSLNIVCKLKHSLYRLKQVPRVWFEKFCSILLGFSFTQNGLKLKSYQYDPSLFLLRTPKGIVALLVYVGDIVQKYIQDLIQLAGLTNSTIVDIPFKVNVKYRREEGEILDDPTLYRKLVGSLIYVTITRSNISFVVHIVSKFMQSP
ncbi:hypothetical protein CR513_56284, partial [Mucuna pruriens]